MARWKIVCFLVTLIAIFRAYTSITSRKQKFCIFSDGSKLHGDKHQVFLNAMCVKINASEGFIWTLVNILLLISESSVCNNNTKTNS